MRNRTWLAVVAGVAVVAVAVQFQTRTIARAQGEGSEESAPPRPLSMPA